MEPLTVTLDPLESTLYPRNESLNQTTWSSEQARWPPSEAEREQGPVYLSLLICVPGVTGNGLLILLLVFCVKRKPFTVYILHLAIADFMVLLCSSVFQLVSTVHLHDDTLLSYIVLLMTFGYNTGLHLLTAISVERCLSVLCPIWYQCRRPRHQSAVACTLLWALSMLVSGLENFFCLLAAEPRFPECRYVYAFSCVLTFLVFVPLMIFSNLILSIQVCRHVKSRPPAKLYVIVMATVVLFLVFAMPMKVLFITVYYSNAGDKSMWKFFPYLNMLSTINCSVNPIVYFVVGGLRRKKSKKSLKEALLRVFEEKPEPSSERVSSPRITTANATVHSREPHAHLRAAKRSNDHTSPSEGEDAILHGPDTPEATAGLAHQKALLPSLGSRLLHKIALWWDVLGLL